MQENFNLWFLGNPYGQNIGLQSGQFMLKNQIMQS